MGVPGPASLKRTHPSPTKPSRRPDSNRDPFITRSPLELGFGWYALCADTRDAARQKALLTDDTHFVVYMAGEGSEATDDLRGRESLTPVFDNLNTYEVTMHFNGQSTVALDGDRATGESYCLAHHVYSDDGERKLMTAAIRYQDTFAKADGTWPSSPCAGPKPARLRRPPLPDAGSPRQLRPPWRDRARSTVNRG